MADFWSLVIGIVGMAIVCIIVLGCIEIADARQNARYHRAQRGRVDGGSSFIDHYGSASK